VTTDQYAAFFSYNSRDGELVEEVARSIHAQGPRVFFDRWYLSLGKPWREKLEEVLNSCGAAVIFVGPGEMGEWQNPEITVALDRQARDKSFLVIPVLLPNAEPPRGFLAQFTWLDFRQGIDDVEALRRLGAAIRGELPSSDVPSDLVEILCPYRGLLPFREEDASFFFGRETFTERLVGAVKAHSFVALIGPSGSGKSSVAHAGLVPQLRRGLDGKVWAVATLRPGLHPLHSLAVALVPLLCSETPDDERLLREGGALARAMLREEVPLSSVVTRILARQHGADCLLLIVDQWEELYYTSNSGSDEESGERRRFIQQLLDASREGYLTVLITLRADFYRHVLEDRRLSERLQDRIVHVSTLERDEARRAMEEPARRVGLSFEKGLVEQILDDLEQEPGQLPLLEFVLRELWKQRRNGSLLSESYRSIGMIKGAIATRADEVLRDSQLPKKDIRRLFTRLVRLEEDAPDTRRKATFDEIGDAGKRVAFPLIESRLLVTSRDPGTGIETVEVAHEALIRNWRRLRGWLNEDRAFLLWRERLGIDIDAWEDNNQEDRFLLSEGPLAEAEQQISGRLEDLSEKEWEFIQRSENRRQHLLEVQEFERQKRLERERRLSEQRKRQRARTRFLVGVGIVLFILLAAITLLYNKRRKELKAKFLSSEAVQLQARALDRALLLATEAQRIHDTQEGRGLILTLLEKSPFLESFLPVNGGTVYQVAFSPDGRWIAGAGVSPPVFWDARSGRRLPLTIKGRGGDVFGVAFGPGGQAATSSNRNIQFWDLATGSSGLSIPLKWRVRNLTFSPDGGLIAASRNEEVRLWDTTSGTHYGGPEPLKVDGPWVSGLAFTPDRRVLAAADAGETIDLWEVATGRSLPPVRMAGRSFLSVAFSPDGRVLASGEAGGKVRLWDGISRRPLGESCARHGGDVLGLAFDSHAKNGVWTLASAGSDGKIFIWEVPTGGWDSSSCTPGATLTGHAGTVWSLAFGPDGRLLSGGENTSLILWQFSQPPRFARPVPGPGGLRSLAHSADGHWIAAGTNDGKLALWNALSLGKPTVVQADHDEITSVAFDQKGGKLACGDKSGRVHVWDLTGGGLKHAPEFLLVSPDPVADKGVWSIAFEPKGARLAVGFGSGRIRLWDIRTGAPVWESGQGVTELVSSLVFSPDAKTLVSGGDDRQIHIWDLASLKEAHSPLQGHSESITSLALNRDGSLLASASSDKTVQIWDVRSDYAKLGPPLVGPENIVANVAFSPDGKRLAAVDLDSSIFLWDVALRRPIVSGLKGREGAIALSFDSTGNFLVTADDQGLLLWDLRFESWRKLACATVRRNLTADEWETYLKKEPYRETCPDLPQDETTP
jgi:WD40 repeat protein